MSSTPELSVSQSGEVFIKPHNSEASRVMVKACQSCQLRKEVCPGTETGNDVKMSMEAPTKIQLKKTLKDAACKPRVELSSLDFLHEQFG
jgi:hypothetical protein